MAKQRDESALGKSGNACPYYEKKNNLSPFVSKNGEYQRRVFAPLLPGGVFPHFFLFVVIPLTLNLLAPCADVKRFLPYKLHKTSGWWRTFVFPLRVIFSTRRLMFLWMALFIFIQMPNYFFPTITTRGNIRKIAYLDSSRCLLFNLNDKILFNKVEV